MKRLLLSIILLAASLSAYSATTTLPSLTLGWDMHQDPSVNGYKLFFGVQSRVYTNSITVLGRTTTSAQVTNLVRGVTYYFAATATATNGLESDYSVEVSWTTTPLPLPPQNLRVTVLSP